MYGLLQTECFFLFPSNLYVKALTTNVMVFGDRSLEGNYS